MRRHYSSPIVRLSGWFVIPLLGLAALCEARVYQWIDPDTGTVQLSGRPPAWYRQYAADRVTDPRVFVFENGQLLDDTGIVLAPEQRAALRAEAFGTQVVPDAALPAGAPLPGTGTPAVAGITPPVPSPAPADTTTDQTVARLRAIVDAWDTLRSEQARSILEQALDPAD